MRANLRAQSLSEEIANSVSHGVGALAAAVAAPFLIVSAVRRGDGFSIVGASIFASTMLLLYLMSTLYHSLAGGRAKRVFQILDHCAIFLLIAGTYTPFTLGALRGAWGWTLLGLVWGIAIAGIVLKAVCGVRYPVLSIALYLGMGWLIVIAAKPLWTHLSMPGLLWLVAGGVAYTAGVGFLAAERVRYGHFIWHLFVLAGTACHFVAVLKYAG
ncbi:MAG: hemolysin III family protein [bacterium]|nr:hemolysin III family protein [bacterium]